MINQGTNLVEGLSSIRLFSVMFLLLHPVPESASIVMSIVQFIVNLEAGLHPSYNI